MPEILKFCGRTLHVVERAGKTCNGLAQRRRMHNTAHLANVCRDRRAREGCQAACLVCCHEAWLKKVE
jgi:hypothetical protein